MLQISAVVVAVGIVVLASLLAPEGKQKKWVNFVLGLVAFSVLATPILSLEDLSFTPPTFSEDGTVSGDPMDYVLTFGEDEIEKMLADVFDADVSHIDVDIGDCQAKTICVTVTAEMDQTGVCRYLEKWLGEEWEVKVNGR